MTDNIYGVIAQLARAPALQAGGRGFDSHWLHSWELTAVYLGICLKRIKPKKSSLKV